MVMIHATFANRTYSPSEFELVDAWDEWSHDENPDGFITSRDAALNSLGDDLLRWATIIIEIPFEAIRRAVNPPQTKVVGTVNQIGGKRVDDRRTL